LHGYWFFGRPTLEELRLDLRAVTKKCRPDHHVVTTTFPTCWFDSTSTVKMGTEFDSFQ
jgi:hypothetical protein